MIKLLIFTVHTNLLSLYSACCYYAQFVCHSMMTGLITSSCNNHAVKLQLVPHMNFMAVWFCLVQFVECLLMVTYSLENRSIIKLYIYTGLDNDVSIISIMVGYCPLSSHAQSHSLAFFFHYRNGSFWPQHFYRNDFTSTDWRKLNAQSCGALWTRYTKSRRLAMP